jgi:hypothetical protein
MTDMLKGLLSREECANCRICCSFDSYDIWETPVITHDMVNRILSDYKPDQKFIRRDDHFLLRLEREKDRDLYYCSLLDHSKGCVMGENKPFDCQIWPFRVMKLAGYNMITLSPVCPVVNQKPISDIVKTCMGISSVIFENAREHPEYVKPYIEGYPIIAIEPQTILGELI